MVHLHLTQPYTQRVVLAIPQRVIVSPDVCAVRLPTTRVACRILEHPELLVTSAAANERHDAGIRRPVGVREFR